MNWEELYNNIYITSDLHLWHKNIMKYEPEQRHQFGETLEEMNEGILKQIDALPPDSTLLNLGDLFLNSRVTSSELESIVARMKQNNKALVIMLGNHDRNMKVEGKHIKDVPGFLKSIGFDGVYTQPYKFMEYVFCHEPVKVERPADDSQGFTGVFPPMICIHGHTHGKMVDEHYFSTDEKPDTTTPSRYVNVCWDVDGKIHYLPDVMKEAEQMRLNFILYKK